MRETADVVVIGGGILGCAAALHLLQAGAGRVVVLERDGIAEGTTSAGAGFVGLWAAGHAHDAWGEEELALEEYALDFYSGLAAEGHEVGWRADGIGWVAATERGWDELIAPYGGQVLIPDAQVLDPDEIAELTGAVSPTGVHRAVYHPRGGRLSARLAARAVAARFEALGGVLEERRPVTEIIVERGRALGVETTHGAVHASAVVVAAGAWTPQLLRGVVARLPMVPLLAARIITEPLGVPASMPPLLFPEYSFLWLREEHGGLLFGSSFECPPRYAVVDAPVPPRLAEVPLDGVFQSQRAAGAAAGAIPALARYRSVRVAHGAPCYTPDLRALVGELEISGLYLVGGCNEAGVTHGPGYGRLVADLVTGRSPLFDPGVFSPERLAPPFGADKDVVAAMAERGRMSWVEVTTT